MYLGAFRNLIHKPVRYPQSCNDDGTQHPPGKNVPVCGVIPEVKAATLPIAAQAANADEVLLLPDKESKKKKLQDGD